MSRMVCILILDDQPHHRYLVSQSLREEGYQTEIVDNTDSAWELWNESQPDMVLMNSLAEGFDSFALLLEIKKKHPEFPALVYAIRSVDAIDRLTESVTGILGKKRLLESAINIQQSRSGEVSISDRSGI
jgi:CheY-like chemotaxis protein